MLITCQVERALRCWTSGIYRPTKKAFSGDNYATRTEIYSRMISGMSEKQWQLFLSDCSRMLAEIVELSEEADGITGSEIEASEMMDPADLAAMDADSDLDD